jgi:hypothetical protein
MGSPASEVGYSSAISRRGDHKVYMDMWWHWKKKPLKTYETFYECDLLYGYV